MREELAKRFFLRFFIGTVPLGFIAVAMLSKGQSGNSGMSPNMEKFVPIVLLFTWAGFLIIEALWHFSKHRIGYSLSSICAVIILAALFFIIMYLEHTL